MGIPPNYHSYAILPIASAWYPSGWSTGYLAELQGPGVDEGVKTPSEGFPSGLLDNAFPSLIRRRAYSTGSR
jgi:hypothetical protein